MSERVAYAGERGRGRPLLEHERLGPWKARVAVVPIRLPRGVLFDVVCEWLGPPLPPLPDPGEAVSAGDSFTTGDQGLARRVAGEAADELRAGRLPRLREIAERAQ